MKSLKNISDMKPADYNPRRITDERAAGLQFSLESFGDLSGITWNKKSGNLVTGHQRLDQLKKLHGEDNLKLTAGTGEGEKILTCPNGDTFKIRVVDWDDLKEKAANVAANNPNIAGEFTDDLQALLDELQEPMGKEFDDLQLAELLAEISEPEPGQTDPDDVPEPPEEPISKTGDLWLLGDHRLLCGDCTKAEDVERVMGGERADCVLTDPPYGIDQPGVPNDAPKMQSDLIAGMVANLPVENAAIVSFQSTRTFPTLLDEMRKTGYKFERILSLYKEAQCTFPWRGWILISESILVFSVGNPPWNEVKPYNHDVYKVSEVSHEIDDSMGWHGSIKPISVVSDILNRISKKGMVVYDPFSGSGTTIIAAEQLNRRCFAIEIEPRYVDVAVKRFEQFTGKEAVLDKSAKKTKAKETLKTSGNKAQGESQ